MTVGLSSDVVIEWLEDREGNVWAGTTGGLDRFRRAKLNRVELPGPAGEHRAGAPRIPARCGSAPPAARCSSVGDARRRSFPRCARPVEMAYRDRDGRGVGRKPVGSLAVGRRTFHAGHPAGVATRGIQAVTQDAAGDLWISVVRSGVYREDR